MKTKSNSQRETRVVATVSGEDLACGDFVAPLNEVVGVPSYLWDGYAASLPPQELVRLTLIPSEAGQPHKVIAICLPFVYARAPGGETVTMDTRRLQIVRLDRKCAKVVWKRLRAKSKKRKR
jgi:hypothetical protein